MPKPRKNFLREVGGHHRVTYVELFFDLVFVFAITQISHSMLAHFTPLGILQTAILMFAVWWVWVFIAWITNWLVKHGVSFDEIKKGCGGPRFGVKLQSVSGSSKQRSESQQ